MSYHKMQGWTVGAFLGHSQSRSRRSKILRPSAEGRSRRFEKKIKKTGKEIKQEDLYFLAGKICNHKVYTCFFFNEFAMRVSISYILSVHERKKPVQGKICNESFNIYS